MCKPFVVLKLEGVLQSYGEKARWDYRDTSYSPTKSAVVGLIACAMGIPRGDKRVVELSKNLTMGVRVDKKGEILTDFQIVNGYHTPVNALIKGGSTREKSNKISYKEYLQDAKFTVVLEGKEELLKEIKEALNNPKYQVFLGRKSCVPTRPIFDSIVCEYDSIEEVLRGLELSERHDKGSIYYEIESREGNKIRYDETKGNVAAEYDVRRVQTGYITK